MSLAKATRLKRSSALGLLGFRSGCSSRASLRYAFLISSLVAPFFSPNSAYKSRSAIGFAPVPLCVIRNQHGAFLQSPALRISQLERTTPCCRGPRRGNRLLPCHL